MRIRHVTWRPFTWRRGGDQSSLTKGGASLKSPQEIPPTCDPVSRGNPIPTGLISTQPGPASHESAGLRRPQCDPQEPGCLRCGLAVPDQPPRPLSLSPVQHSSRRNRSRSSTMGSNQPAATQSDACLRLLLACLSCQCSVLLLGLLESCSSCLLTLCSSCCHTCARCCSAVRETPVEELNCHAHCHSVMFESCCEPTECLEFCLECCDICHRG